MTESGQNSPTNTGTCEHLTPRLDGALLRCAICYPLPSKGPQIQFTYGKEDFHGPTIKERQDRHIADLASAGKQMGRDYSPAGERWV